MKMKATEVTNNVFAKYSANILFGHEESGTWVTETSLSLAGIASCMSPKLCVSPPIGIVG
jgi:hypothetical protein